MNKPDSLDGPVTHACGLDPFGSLSAAVGMRSRRVENHD